MQTEIKVEFESSISSKASGYMFGNVRKSTRNRRNIFGNSRDEAPVPASGIWVEHALLMAFLLVASAILFVTRSESSFPVAIKAFHYLDVPWFIVLTLLLARREKSHAFDSVKD